MEVIQLAIEFNLKLLRLLTLGGAEERLGTDVGIHVASREILNILTEIDERVSDRSIGLLIVELFDKVKDVILRPHEHVVVPDGVVELETIEFRIELILVLGVIDADSDNLGVCDSLLTSLVKDAGAGDAA